MVATLFFFLFSLLSFIFLYFPQDILGAEGISLQLRHIATYLLWYCSSDDLSSENQQLLHLVIQLVGYFAVKNHDNQVRKSEVWKSECLYAEPKLFQFESPAHTL